MTLKAPSQVKTMGVEEANSLNQTTTRAFSTRMESIKVTTSGTTTDNLYQATEHGILSFSSNGSSTIVKTQKLAETHGTIVYAEAHSTDILASAFVTDVTNTSIELTLRTISGTAEFSAVTTASIKVFYKVVGSSP